MEKILLLTFYYPPYTSGGIGFFNYELARGFAKEDDFKVIVVSGGNEDIIKNHNKIKIYYLKSLMLRPKEFYFQFYNANRIVKIIKKERPNIILLNSLFTYPLKMLKETKSNSVVIQVLHGAPSSFSRPFEGLKNKMLGEIAWTLAWDMFGRINLFLSDPLDYVDAIVHVSKHVMYYNLHYSKLREKMKEKPNTVIYPGLNLEDFELLRCKFQEIGKICKSLIFGARLVPYKGIIPLLKAFRLAWEDDKNIILNIFGDGPLRSQVVRMIKKMRKEGVRNIHYHGKAPREKFLENVAKNYLLVHPSLYEAMSMVLIESSLLGTPVLAHKAPYSEEEVEALKIGKTVETRNIEKFANVLLNEVNSDEMIEKLTKSLDNIKKIFNIRRAVKEYIELYNKLK